MSYLRSWFILWTFLADSCSYWVCIVPKMLT
jgi:hypothetical protein